MTEPTIYWNAPRGTTMYACKDGEYVAREDHARLEQECERLRDALKAIGVMQSHECTIGQNLKDAVRIACEAMSAKP